MSEEKSVQLGLCCMNTTLKKKNPDIKLLSQDSVNHGVPSGIINQMKSLEDWLI